MHPLRLETLRLRSWRRVHAGLQRLRCKHEGGGYQDAEDKDDGKRRQVLHGGAECGKHGFLL